MGWLRLVGSIKVQVSFAKEPYKRDDLTVATPPHMRYHKVMCVRTHSPDSCSNHKTSRIVTRGGGLGSRPIFKKFHETYAPS